MENVDETVVESSCLPAAISPGYPPAAEENVAVDFPPADLSADTDEFRIVVTHVDDDCHIYGHALRAGITLICLITIT